LGLTGADTPERDELLVTTLQLLADTQVGYHQFFFELSKIFKLKWAKDVNSILHETEFMPQVMANSGCEKWFQLYHRVLSDLSESELQLVGGVLDRSNPQTILLRPQIEAIWEPIVENDDWEPFYTLLGKIRAGE
jgi:serine/tyrosine/threonine adenylyltransferase